MPNHQRGQSLSLRVIQLLAKERETRKVTKYSLAQKSGVSPQMIGYIEKGERNPTLEIVCRLAVALEVDLSKLVRKAEQDVSQHKAE